MTYAKPELVALTHAVEAIQGGQPKSEHVEDSRGTSLEIFNTPAAYEADE